MNGLEHRIRWPLYCSDITARILPVMGKGYSRVVQKGGDAMPNFVYEHVRHFLRPLPMETPTMVHTDSGDVRVTLLNANHCPGSVMILFQGDNGTVLYTGDMRAETYFLDGLRQCPALMDGNRFIDIDKIYLDTTFFHPAFEEFPTKVQSVDALVEVLKECPPSTHFKINTAMLGYEPVWMKVAKAFDTKIYLHPSYYIWYTSFQSCTPSSSTIPTADITEYLTTDPKSTRFHACKRGCSVCEWNWNRGISVQVNCSAAGWRDRIGVVMRKGQRMEDGHLVKGKFVVESGTGSRSLKVLYGMHSSYSELLAMVEMLRPREVFACVVNREAEYDGRYFSDFEPFLNREPGVVMRGGRDDVTVVEDRPRSALVPARSALIEELLEEISGVGERQGVRGGGDVVGSEADTQIAKTRSDDGCEVVLIDDGEGSDSTTDQNDFDHIPPAMVFHETSTSAKTDQRSITGPDFTIISSTQMTPSESALTARRRSVPKLEKRVTFNLPPSAPERTKSAPMPVRAVGTLGAVSPVRRVKSLGEGRGGGIWEGFRKSDVGEGGGSSMVGGENKGCETPDPGSSERASEVPAPNEPPLRPPSSDATVIVLPDSPTSTSSVEVIEEPQIPIHTMPSAPPILIDVPDPLAILSSPASSTPNEVIDLTGDDVDDASSPESGEHSRGRGGRMKRRRFDVEEGTEVGRGRGKVRKRNRNSGGGESSDGDEWLRLLSKRRRSSGLSEVGGGGEDRSGDGVGVDRDVRVGGGVGEVVGDKEKEEDVWMVGPVGEFDMDFRTAYPKNGPHGVFTPLLVAGENVAEEDGRLVVDSKGLSARMQSLADHASGVEGCPKEDGTCGKDEAVFRANDVEDESEHHVPCVEPGVQRDDALLLGGRVGEGKPMNSLPNLDSDVVQQFVDRQLVQMYRDKVLRGEDIQIGCCFE
ncbi:hypothetical protein HDV00_004227 [Rhizophlyctis rosea]|nr:hypothetical protein HDV00_004227 [Rhizophlyctis rosea]